MGKMAMEPAGRLAPGEIPDAVMAYILRSLPEIRYGELILVAQDERLVQVERQEKLRLADWPPCRAAALRTASRGDCLARHIRQSFAHLAYGQLEIIVRAGAAVQLERTERQRFTGLDGEGI